MKKLLLTWLFKLIEIALVSFLGWLVYLLITLIFSQFWGIVGLTIVFYFFGGLIRPYIRELQEYIFNGITNNEEE